MTSKIELTPKLAQQLADYIDNTPQDVRDDWPDYYYAKGWIP